MKPVTKTSVVDQVIKIIMSAIKRGEWKVGEKIPGEIELTHTLGVSRTSIREALRVLSYFNVIISKQKSGTILAPNALRLLNSTDLVLLLSEDQEMEELMEIRFFLEPQIAYWAAIRATPKDIQELNQILDGTKTLTDVREKTIQQKLEISAAFHSKLAQICRNKLITKILNSIHDEMGRQRVQFASKWQTVPEKLDKVMLEHKDILNSIKAKNPERARDLLLNHLLEGLIVFEKDPRTDSTTDAHPQGVVIEEKKE